MPSFESRSRSPTSSLVQVDKIISWSTFYFEFQAGKSFRSLNNSARFQAPIDKLGYFAERAGASRSRGNSPTQSRKMWTVKRLRTNSYGIFSRNLLSLQRANFGNEKTERVMAIRREDINVWERRAPIGPSHVAELVNKGIRVLVQPSTRRAYTMDEYERAGAVITEDLSPASLIIGVKAVPIDLLIPNKTYAFFSHTIKAQEANMPLLDAMLEKVT